MLRVKSVNAHKDGAPAGVRACRCFAFHVQSGMWSGKLSQRCNRQWSAKWN